MLPVSTCVLHTDVLLAGNAWQCRDRVGIPVLNSMLVPTLSPDVWVDQPVWVWCPT